MRVRLVEDLGYCPGVKRTISLAESTIAACDSPNAEPGPSPVLADRQAEAGDPGRPQQRVSAIGELIHSKIEVERLEKLGLVTVEDISGVETGKVLIRAHGVRPDVYRAAQDRGVEVIDGTCGQVLKAQKAAQELAGAGRTIVIYGDREHPEVQGILGSIGDAAYVVESPADVDELPPDPGQIGVISQTTKTPRGFDAVLGRLRERFGDENVVCKDTLCPHVRKRQIDTERLAVCVDLMIVVGGLKSSNTKSLVEVCSACGVAARHIASADEIDQRWFEGAKTVGITAGVSTPPDLVESARRKIAGYKP
jgi:(E)-4-hydroxy-3-methyl-but-2-enyl pyrophosphate reductase